MRTAIILAREHDGKTFSLLSGPEAGIVATRAAFKEFQRSATHPTIAEACLWESDRGLVKKIKRMAAEASSEKSTNPKKK